MWMRNLQISPLNPPLNRIRVKPYGTLTHRVTPETIVGRADGVDALRQTIRHILSTERYAYPMYSDNYGVELQQLYGKSMAYAKAKIHNILNNALTQDDRVLSVTVNKTEERADGVLYVLFTVNTNLGQINEEWGVQIWGT